MNKLRSFKNILFLLILFLIAINPHSEGYSQQEEQTNYIPVTFRSEDSKVYGRFFKAASNKPVPTVILLHGFPGGEGDLFGLGKRLNQDSINAFTFNYRGTWKSEGIYLPETSLKDVIKSVEFLKSPDISNKYSIDTTQIILLGYSYGSSMAILGSLHHSSVEKIITICTTDLSVSAKMIEESNAFRKRHQEFLDKYMSDSTIARGSGGKALHKWIIAHKDEYNLVKHAEELSNKQVLLIGGWNDNAAPIEDHTIPFYRALQKNDAQNVKIEVYQTDHAFRNIREQSYQCVLDYIRK